jgi:hypothetical protein
MVRRVREGEKYIETESRDTRCKGRRQKGQREREKIHERETENRD